MGIWSMCECKHEIAVHEIESRDSKQNCMIDTCDCKEFKSEGVKSQTVGGEVGGGAVVLVQSDINLSSVTTLNTMIVNVKDILPYQREILKDIVESYITRCKVGIEKYGDTFVGDPKQHLWEEQIDGIFYTGRMRADDRR